MVQRKLIVGISGASGVVYGIRLLPLAPAGLSRQMAW